MWKKLRSYFGAERTQSERVELNGLSHGASVQFSRYCPLPELTNQSFVIQRVRRYHLGQETTINYVLVSEEGKEISLSIAEDESGYYLGIMRELSSAEQRAWFDPDALSFFIEPSSAKTLKCRAGEADMRMWAAEKYQKTIDFLHGSIREYAPNNHSHERSIHYSMLQDVSGERAIEIEVYPDHGLTRVFATVFRPAEDIISIQNNGITPPFIELAEPHMRAEIIPINPHIMQELANALQEEEGDEEENQEESRILTRKPIINDFRRLGEPDVSLKYASEDYTPPPVPAFLLHHRAPNGQASTHLFEQILAIESEVLECDTATASALLAKAQAAGDSVEEVVRDLLALREPTQEHVMLEVHLTDHEYTILAKRYGLNEDARADIRARIVEELKTRIQS